MCPVIGREAPLVREGNVRGTLPAIELPKVGDVGSRTIPEPVFVSQTVSTALSTLVVFKNSVFQIGPAEIGFTYESLEKVCAVQVRS